MDLTHHEFTYTDGKTHCTKCGGTWRFEPKWLCPGVPKYEWHKAPENLKTEKDLKAMGLRPTGEPKGCLWYHTTQSYIWLYDMAETEPRPAATEKQLAAIARAQAAKTCQGCGRSVYRKRELYQMDGGHYCGPCAVISMLRRDLADPISLRILDTETTGLGDDAEVIEIAVIDGGGLVLLNTLVKPTGPIPEDASNVNGIWDADVAEAPTWPEVWPTVIEVLRGKRVYAYNAEFDSRMIRQTRTRHGFEENTGADWHCAMQTFMIYAESRRKISLANACSWMGVPAGHHRALGDARATLRLLQAVAARKIERADA